MMNVDLNVCTPLPKASGRSELGHPFGAGTAQGAVIVPIADTSKEIRDRLKEARLSPTQLALQNLRKEANKLLQDMAVRMEEGQNLRNEANQQLLQDVAVRMEEIQEQNDRLALLVLGMACGSSGQQARKGSLPSVLDQVCSTELLRQVNEWAAHFVKERTGACDALARGPKTQQDASRDGGIDCPETAKKEPKNAAETTPRRHQDVAKLERELLGKGREEQEKVLRRPEILSLDEAAAYSRHSVRTLSRWRSEGRVLALVRPGAKKGFRFPSWQFHEAVIGVMPSILKAFGLDRPWQAYDFLTRPEPLLKGQIPLDLLRAGKKDEVLRIIGSAASLEQGGY